jgi:hypothetical protein
MQENLKSVLATIPQQFQRQDATNDQLRDLYSFANRLGLYDAADLIRSMLERNQPQSQTPNLLATLKERHEVAMALLFDPRDSEAGNSYIKSSKSGKVTQLLQSHGIEPNIPQKMVG